MNRPANINDLLDLFRIGTQHLTEMSAAIDAAWMPDDLDAQRLHNLYVRNLVTAYVAKVSQLSNELLDAVEHSRFLILRTLRPVTD